MNWIENEIELKSIKMKNLKCIENGSELEIECNSIKNWIELQIELNSKLNWTELEIENRIELKIENFIF